MKIKTYPRKKTQTRVAIFERKNERSPWKKISQIFHDFEKCKIALQLKKPEMETKKNRTQKFRDALYHWEQNVAILAVTDETDDQ